MSELDEAVSVHGHNLAEEEISENRIVTLER